MGDLVKLSPELENKISYFENTVFKVETNEMRGLVMARIVDAKSIRKSIMDFFKESREAADRAHKAIVANQKTFTDRLDNVIAKGNDAVLEYDEIAEELREIERARLQAIEEKRAERERQRLLKRSEKLKTPELKEQALEEAEEVEAHTVTVEGPKKVKGEYYKTTWKARIINVDLIPREYMIPNQALLDNHAMVTKGKEEISGVEFYSDKKLIIRK